MHRPRLDDAENEIIQKYRSGKLELEKEIIASIISSGDTVTKAKYELTDTELDAVKESQRFEELRYPKILLIDIETLFLKVASWGLFKQSFGHKNVLQDWSLLSWAAKWLYDPEVIGDCMTPEEASSRKDERITRSVWNLMNEADIVIAHNGIRFDFRRLNAKFWEHGLSPVSSYHPIDTLKEYQKEMGFSSHRLDYIGKLIDKKGKLPTDFELWLECDKGNQEALNYMLSYNKEDVLLLEEAYLEIRPFIKNHPNLSIYAESTEKCCGKCLSTNLEEIGKYVTPAGRFVTYRCQNCGNPYIRSRTTDLTKKERDNLLIPTTR